MTLLPPIDLAKDRERTLLLRLGQSSTASDLRHGATLAARLRRAVRPVDAEEVAAIAPARPADRSRRFDGRIVPARNLKLVALNSHVEADAQETESHCA